MEELIRELERQNEERAALGARLTTLQGEVVFRLSEAVAAQMEALVERARPMPKAPPPHAVRA